MYLEVAFEIDGLGECNPIFGPFCSDSELVEFKLLLTEVLRGPLLIMVCHQEPPKGKTVMPAEGGKQLFQMIKVLGI